MTANAPVIQTRLRDLGSPNAVAQSARFVKTGPGHYGAADVLVGIRAGASEARRRIP
jgi:hypothetical protein